MIIILSHQCPGQHVVRLLRDGQKFAVEYGHDQKRNLTESQAAHEFGECVMHAAKCANLFDY